MLYNIEDPTPPTAKFTVSPNSGTTSYNFAFDASGSTDNEDPKIDLQVRWDYENNGSWDTGWDYDKTVNHQYGSADIYTAKLEVKDTEGLTDQYSESITVEKNVGGGTPPTGYFIDSRDGQEYGYIEIGNQTWMAENLNYVTTNSWTYKNDSANGDVYGRLYPWDEAMIACPIGWHLPTDHEWKILEMELGMNQNAADDTGWRGTDEGEKMKSTSGWNDNGNGTNSSGFNALSGGFRQGGFFLKLSYSGCWWSSSVDSGSRVWHRHLGEDNNQSTRTYIYKPNCVSVRCVKD